MGAADRTERAAEGDPSAPTAAPSMDGSLHPGLRRYMLSVYNHMALAMLLTGLVALGFTLTGAARAVFFGGVAMRWLVMLAPLAFVIAINVNSAKMRPAMLYAMFWGFAATMGISLSTIFLVYDPINIVQAFAATAAGFAALSLYSYGRKQDPTIPHTFLVMGITGLVVAGGITLFGHSGRLGLIISVGGVLLFAGLTVVDTQKTRETYFQVAGTPGEARAAIMAALKLYMDFIAMFLFVLKLFGKTPDETAP